MSCPESSYKHRLGTHSILLKGIVYCCVCRSLVVMRLRYYSDLYHLMVSLHSGSLLIFIYLCLFIDYRAHAAGEGSLC